MRFYARKKRTPAITIVSLIDILAILLIFFIVTTTFKRRQPQVLIELPESKTAEKAPSETEPLILAISADEKIFLDEKPVEIAELAAALRRYQTDAPKRQLAMQADKGAPFGRVIEVLDAMKEAGIRNLPTLTKEPE